MLVFESMNSGLGKLLTTIASYYKQIKRIFDSVFLDGNVKSNHSIFSKTVNPLPINKISSHTKI